MERVAKERSDPEAPVDYGSIQAGSKHVGAILSEDIEAERLIPKGAKQVGALDIVRNLCVFLVVVDHGGTTFGPWNTMYVQGWVLQYLFFVSGICLGISKRSVWGHVQKLSIYFVIGVCCNWSAFIIMGLDWQHNFFNVIFQFFFIVALIWFFLILAPLRTHLRSITERRESMQHEERPLSMNLMIAGVGAVIVTLASRLILTPVVQSVFATPLTVWATSMGEAAVFWDLPQTVMEADAFLWRFVSYFELTMINIYLAIVWPLLSKNWGFCGWLMILNTYAHKVFLYRAQEARLLTGFDCTTIGLTVFFLGLNHRQTVGKYLVRYWFMCLFCLALLWPPGTYGRFDEHPPRELGPRMKDNLIEMFFTILFLCAFDRMADGKGWVEDNLEWLGHWALLAFLIHKAVHITTPSPYNWIFLFGVCPAMCWLLFGKKNKDPSQPEAASTPST